MQAREFSGKLADFEIHRRILAQNPLVEVLGMVTRIFLNPPIPIIQ
jgi:hypothetical protein